MGQYYRVILKNKNGYERVYNREVDKEYTMAKLMEHSWWLNPFVSSICAKLYKNPHNVSWIGDYADQSEKTPVSQHEVIRLYNKAWSNHIKGNSIHEKLFYLDHRYLCNHTKKCFLDCQAYYEKNNGNGWCIHPLPILTSIGNGLGGGDFRYVTKETTTEYVGDWATDEISVEDDIPKDFQEIHCIFKEKY